MYAITGAKERTLRELSDVASPAGWKIVSIKRSEGGLWAYTTLVPV